MPRLRMSPSGEFVNVDLLFRQIVGNFMQDNFLTSSDDYTNILVQDGGDPMSVTLPEARLETSSLLVIFSCCCRATAQEQALFRILVDGNPIDLPGASPAKLLVGGLEFAAGGSEMKSLAVHALVPPSLLPAAAAHVLMPQIKRTLGAGQIQFVLTSDFGGAGLTVVEVLA